MYEALSIAFLQVPSGYLKLIYFSSTLVFVIFVNKGLFTENWLKFVFYMHTLCFRGVSMHHAKSRPLNLKAIVAVRLEAYSPFIPMKLHPRCRTHFRKGLKFPIYLSKHVYSILKSVYLEPRAI